MKWHFGVRIRRARWLGRCHGICRILTALALCHSAALSAEFDNWLARQLNSRVPLIEQRLDAIRREMEELPVPIDLDALGSHGFHSDFTLDSESNWFEISWSEPQTIDGIAVVPTRLTTQSGDMSNYGFPNRLLVEAMIPGAMEPVVIAELANSRLDFRKGEPVFFSIPAVDVTSIRFIPVDLPFFPGKRVRFFSLSEVMVFQGERNIAPDGNLSANYSIDAEAGWNIRYLTDGESPLGPPEVPPASLSLGWHADLAESAGTKTWAAVDLGRECRVDAVRIVAARGDSPVKGPGFGFPVRFSIEVTDDEEASPWETVWDSGEFPFANPGYNPVILRFAPVRARHVRLFITGQHQPDRLTAPRVLLSEIEVLDGQVNLALGKPVTTPNRDRSRPHDAHRVWNDSGLTDGYSSTGRLIPLRRWVEDLSRRFDLALERQALNSEHDSIIKRTFRTSLINAFGLLSTVIIGLIIWLVRLRLAGHRRIRELRHRISSDLHDEVGSNLATIALLAEIKPVNDPVKRFGDISRMAYESSLSLREIVDISLAPKRARKPLPERLREISSLMLKDHAWSFTGDASPNLDPEQRRNLVFFIKEALHNISNHASAKHVEVAFETNATHAMLTVADDGCGLPELPPPGGGHARLRALEQRATSLHGTLSVETKAGAGTTLRLRFPLINPNIK